eukprot:279019-Chlamydomonas_euryale.AAC.1
MHTLPRRWSIRGASAAPAVPRRVACWRGRANALASATCSALSCRWAAAGSPDARSCCGRTGPWWASRCSCRSRRMSVR